MTPKEKAKELVDKYINLYPSYIIMFQGDIDKAQSDIKQCALIAVDEMLEEISKWAGGEFQEWEKERWKYLQEVKQDIQRL